MQSSLSSGVGRPISSSISSQFQKQKPVEWISSLIQRYQDQLPTNTGKPIDRETRQLLNTSHTCIINVSKHHLHLVILALVRVLKGVNSSRWTSEVALSQSRMIVLQTLLECLNEAEPISGRNVERECCMKNVLEEMWILINCTRSGTIKNKALAIVARVGALHSGLMLNRLERALQALKAEESDEEQNDLALAHINIMSNVVFSSDYIIRIISLVHQMWPVRKEHIEIVCNMLSSVLWKWIEGNPAQFSSLQHTSNSQIFEVCDALFLAMNTYELRRRAICWPVQMMLIAISPVGLCSMDSNIQECDNSLVNLPPIVVAKKQFLDTVVAVVQSYVTNPRPIWSGQVQYACHAAVNLCKCATFVTLSDFFIFTFVQSLIEHVKSVLLTGSRPREMDRKILVDCFVSLFRLKFDNDMFRVCLTSSQSILQLVLVEALIIISTQPRLHWWPKIDMIMSRSDQLRALLMSVIEKVLESDPISSSSGHLPLSVSRSWQKMSGKFRVERNSTYAANGSDTSCSQQRLLIALLKLITTQPLLLIRQRGKEDEGCIDSIVSALVLLIDHPQLHSGAMQALLALHSVIPYWNSTSPKHAMQSFFTVGSHMLFSVCQKLIHFQIPNAEHVITWMKAIMQYRIDFVKRHHDLVTEDLVDAMTAQSLIKFEAVCFLYLWSCDSDMVLCALSLFELNAVHTAQICSNLASPLSAHLSSASNIITAGRVVLQKSVYRHLRTLPYCNAALNEAWHESYRIWDLFTNHLVSGSKDQIEFIEHVTRIAAYSAATTDGSQSMVDVWANISGFLCSLSHLVYANEQNHVTSFLSKLLSVLRVESANMKDVMCKNVKELVSFEMDYSLDHFILHIISVHLMQHTSNGQFVEHIIYILKNMLSRRSVVVLKTESTIQIISALLAHAEQPGIRLDQISHAETISNKSAGSGNSSGSQATTKAITLVKKLSGLISLIIDNSTTQKMPNQIQSRLIEYFVNTLSALPGYSNSALKCEATLSALQALSKLLGSMSISLSPLNFNKIFNLLVETFNHAFSSTQFNQTAPPEVPGTLLLPSTTNSGNENSGFSSPDVIANIEDTALNAVAHVVGSNLELGISRLIDTAWTGEPKLRRWILEAICRVLSQKSSGNANTLSEVNAQQCELLKLITIISDEGSLPLVNALINALPNDNVDQLSRVLVIAFSERHLLSELLWTVLIREAECVMSPSTLFRGSSLAAKIISYCFRVFGVSYLYETLSPLFQMMQKTPDRSYEIEQDRLPSGTTAEAGIEATLQVAELAFNLILQSESKFPFQLKSVCHAIYHVINSRFPGCGLSALGKILFLRFFNPVIVSPYESQMIGRRPTKAMSRGLTLISKILQTTVNQPTHPKESSMIHFQQLMLSKIDAVNNFLSTVALNETAETWMDNEITTQPSVNLPLLQNIHELFSKNRCEIVQHLRLLATHTNLCSRIDALLHALPDQLPSRQLLALNDSCDPSLPAFYQINSEHHSNSAPIFILVLRRVLSSDLDTIKKQIEERHSKGKFICVVDCLCCEYPANLAKLFPANVLQSIERFIVLFCSPKIFTQLNDAHFSKLPIFFDLSSIAVHYDSLPPLTLRQMSTQAFSVYRAKILSANETDVVVKLIDNTVKLDREARWRGRPITVSEIFPCAAFEQIELINDKTVTFLINENHIISLRLEKAREFVDKIFIMRSKNSVAVCADAHIHLQANYKDVITLSLVNMMDQDVLVRCVAYRLLNTLTTTLNLDISSHVQEAPCVCVPTNPATFLMPIIDILVENQPTLLLNMLPKIVHHPNASSLIGATINAWKILGKLENEQLNELFTLLISATSMHTPFSSLILSNVWPIIGEQTTILDSLLTYMLRSSHSLQLLTEISQSLVTKSCAFSNIVINRIMGELSSTTDNNLPKLLALLLVMSFDLSQIDIENQLANIMHVTTCLAGNSSRFIRCTIFAITSNIFHGFGANTKYKFTEEFHRCLSIFLRQLNSEETLRLFNVLDYGSGPNVVDAVMKMINEHDDNEIYAKSASEDSSSDHQPSDVSHEEDNKQQVSLSNIHQLVSLMMAMVADIEKAMENKREWLVEWRSMTRHWVFQPTFPPNLQIRALIAYSCLATSVSDADIKAIVSMLLQVVKRRESLTSISGVTLSLIRLHTLTTSNCAVHRFVFWIAILLFQLEHATIYEYAIQLLHANLVNLDQMGVFEHTSIEKMAMESRVHLEWDLKALDQYAGLSFKANFNFALVGYLLKGLRQPFLSTKVSQLLQLLLRITAKCSHSNPFILTKETLPYLLALLPFDEKVQQRFRLSSNPDQQNTRCVLQPQWTIQGLQPPDVFTENPVINVWNEDEEEETTILLDPNIINEEQLQSLTVTVLAILARSCPNVHIVLDYLLEAVSVFPSVVPVIECLLDQKIVGLVQSCHSVQMLSTVVKLIETSALEDSPAGITPQQVCSFLQQSGFAGLWRYAGAFLSPRASRQAINANLVSCLECIVACLGST